MKKLTNLVVTNICTYGKGTDYLIEFNLDLDGVTYEMYISKYPNGWFFNEGKKIGGKRCSNFKNEIKESIVEYVLANYTPTGEEVVETEESLLIEKLNETKEGIFQEVVSKIEKINSIAVNFNHTNLKIHNVSYYLYQAVMHGIIKSDNEATNLFSHICEMEFMYFEEWESENLQHVERSYIGRTSSFYYKTKYIGSEVDEYTVDKLLEGNTSILKELFQKLDVSLYDYLIKDIDFKFDENIHDATYFDEDFETLEIISDDLDEILEIVEEAKKAYDYLSEYKTEENEYALVKNFLEFEIEQYYAEEHAEKLFNTLLSYIEKFNKVESISVRDYSMNVTGTYTIYVTENNNLHALPTDIRTDHELSELLITNVVERFKELLENSFE